MSHSQEMNFDRFWELMQKDSHTQPPMHNIYIGLSVLTIILFFALFHLFYQLNSFFNKTFSLMNFKDKCEYISRINGILHAILATILAYFGVFQLCANPSETIFSDAECMNSPKIFHGYSAVFTIGYLVYDFIVMLVIVRDFTQLGMQQYLHHIVAVTGFSFAIMTKQNIALTGCILNQFTEISTPFINIRYLLFSHKMQETQVFVVNTLLFAITFFFGRMSMQFYFLYSAFPILTDLL